jgi:hypothetical protein
MDWTSVRDCIRESYEVAKHEPVQYLQLANQSRQRMLNWASNEAVWKRLEAAMNDLVTGNLDRDSETPSDEILRIIKFPTAKAA